MDKEYLSCAETAKLVRAALKKKFPLVKFSVRSDVYSGGASIDIGWLLGPTTKEVDEIGKQFASASFDGMIDMEVHWEHWLLPDGSVRLKSGPGSEGSRGTIPRVEETPMPEGARPVRFGSHYVFSQRRYGVTGDDEMKLREQVSRDMCKLQGVEYTGTYTSHLFGAGDTEQVDQHAWRLLNGTSFAPGEVYAGVRYAESEERDNDLLFNFPIRIIKKSDAVEVYPLKSCAKIWGGAINGKDGSSRTL